VEVCGGSCHRPVDGPMPYICMRFTHLHVDKASKIRWVELSAPAAAFPPATLSFASAIWHLGRPTAHRLPFACVRNLVASCWPE
jgi:hypothetical protein